MYSEFQEQLQRYEGLYETRPPWKRNHPPLSNNKRGNIRSLNSVTKNARETKYIIEQYNEIILKQLKKEIVEAAKMEAHGKEFYLHCKPVFNHSAETTELWIVYDRSARDDDKAPSMNECLQACLPPSTVEGDGERKISHGCVNRRLNADIPPGKNT